MVLVLALLVAALVLALLLVESNLTPP